MGLEILVAVEASGRELVDIAVSNGVVGSVAVVGRIDGDPVSIEAVWDPIDSVDLGAIGDGDPVNNDGAGWNAVFDSVKVDRNPLDI